VCRFNWVVFAGASIVLWAFVIGVLASDKTDPAAPCVAVNPALDEFGMWQTWITQNFTWFYIATQNVWSLFVVYMGVSRFGKIRLGKDTEKPAYSDFAWFSMLFCSGIGIGLYMYGVSEPIYYYRGYGNSLFKVPWQNDDQFAQQAIFLTYYHWGFHAWGCYILVALLLAFVSFRWDMPMTLRIAFYPLVGDVVHGFFGDFVDFVSMGCTTFGVCTSLGMGVDIIFAGIRRLDCGHGAICDSTIPIDDGCTASKQWKVAIICIITFLATFSVVCGLRKGLLPFSLLTFTLGNLLLFMLVYLDNTWYLLNGYVQSLGHYIQYVTVVGFQCDTFEQLNLEFSKSSMLWDQNFWKKVGDEDVWTGKVSDIVASTTSGMASGPSTFGSHANYFLDWWTIFYWGWWVSWAPFVGMFIGTISRGRTIRQVVFGAFLAPIIYSFFFLGVLGHLGIKMQRITELSLNQPPLGNGINLNGGTVNCTAMGYDGGVPASEEAIALAGKGYFPLQCRGHNDRFWDVLMPYGEGIYMFLGVISLIGVVFYFVTSSDSGSFVDDTLSAGGLIHCPPLQRIYWATTEGACACALMYGGGTAALKALRAVSIVSGFPLSIAICFMCAALHRACKYDLGELDIINSTRFITGLWDFTEGFKPNMPNLPNGVQLPDVGTRAVSLATSIFAPFLTLHDMNVKLWGSGAQSAVLTASIAVCFISWIGCMFGELGSVNASYVGWVLYTCMVALITYVRMKAREAYNVYGFWLEDACAVLVMWPFVCSQLSLQAKNVEPSVDINADPNAHLYEKKAQELPMYKEGTPAMAQAPPDMGMQGLQSVPPVQYAAPPQQPMQYAAPPQQYAAAPMMPVQDFQIGTA